MYYHPFIVRSHTAFHFLASKTFFPTLSPDTPAAVAVTPGRGDADCGGGSAWGGGVGEQSVMLTERQIEKIILEEL